MIVLAIICLLVWFVWGAAFDPKDKRGRVESAIRNPRRFSRAIMEKWVKEAKDVLMDPTSSMKDKEKAIRDIDVFSSLMNRRRA